MKTSSRQRAWVLSDPRLSSPDRMRKKRCYGQKNFGSICSSLSLSPTHLTNNQHQPFSRIKCERYIFIKKCNRSFIQVFNIVDYVSAYIWIMYVYMYTRRIQHTYFSKEYVNPNSLLGGYLPECQVDSIYIQEE